MHGFTDLEEAVMDKLLAGDHPILAALRVQAEAAHLAEREYTGHGIYCTFEIPVGTPPVVRQRFFIDDVFADVNGLEVGVGFVLFVEDGYLALLEGFSYSDGWPAEIATFNVVYEREPRELTCLPAAAP